RIRLLPSMAVESSMERGYEASPPRWGALEIALARILERDRLVAFALALAFLALRLPFRSDFLVNWDAVQFALGTESFSLEHHQPHPPGYIGYVAAGWFLNLFTGNANTSLTLISAVSGAVAPALFYLLGLELLRSRWAALAGA